MTEQTTKEKTAEDSDKMVKSPDSISYRPELMIPFVYTREDAIKAFHDYYEGRPLLPSVIKKDLTPEEMDGGFVPYLLYTGTADVNIAYEAQDSQNVGGDPRIVKQIRDYKVRQTGTARYHRVQVNASREITDAFMETLEPYHYKDLTPIEDTTEFDDIAELMEIEEDTERMENRLSQIICEAFRATVKHSYVKETEQNLHFNHDKVECILCPMWVRQVRIGRRYYNFAMNGQTGKIHADIPPSGAKTSAAFLGYFIAGSAVSYLLMSLIWYFMGTPSDKSVQVIALLSVIIGFIVSNHFMQKLFEKMKKPKIAMKKPDLKQKHYASCTIQVTGEKEKLVQRQMVNSRNVAVKTEEF